MTKGGQVGRIVVQLVMVNVMYFKCILSLVALCAAALATMVVSLLDKALESAGKFRAIRKGRDTTFPTTSTSSQPFALVRFRNLSPRLSRDGVPFVRQREFPPCLLRNRWTRMTFESLRQLLSRLSRNLSPPEQVCPLVANSPGSWLTFIPCWLTRLKLSSCRLCSCAVSYLKPPWLSHAIYRGNQFATATSAWNLLHCKSFGSLLSLMISLSLSSSQSHATRLSYRQWYVKGGD